MSTDVKLKEISVAPVISIKSISVSKPAVPDSPTNRATLPEDAFGSNTLNTCESVNVDLIQPEFSGVISTEKIPPSKSSIL